MENNLTVLIHGTVAGTIKQEQGRHLFEYEPAYLDSKLNTPLSISVPIKLGKHDVGAWLEGLLPDNPFVLKRWQELHGVA